MTGHPSNCIYNKWTDFDPAKDGVNQQKHGVSLARWVDLDIITTYVDDRHDYGEVRYRAYGLIDGLSYCLTFTERDKRVRPISLRRAHAKEMKRYAP